MGQLRSAAHRRMVVGPIGSRLPGVQRGCRTSVRIGSSIPKNKRARSPHLLDLVDDCNLSLHAGDAVMLSWAIGRIMLRIQTPETVSCR